MIEQHLKTLSNDYNFPYNHLNKILTCDLTPPFTIQYQDKKLKFLGIIDQKISDNKEDLFLKLMQLNLGLTTVEHLNLGLTSDDKICLNAEFCYEINYKMLKDQIESFANHLDRLSVMVEQLNKKS